MDPRLASVTAITHTPYAGPRGSLQRLGALSSPCGHACETDVASVSALYLRSSPRLGSAPRSGRSRRWEDRARSVLQDITL